MEKGEKIVTVGETEKESSKKPRNPNRRGKGASQRNQEQFRNRKNQQMEAERLSDIYKRLGDPFGDADTVEVKNVINEVQLTPQVIAKPLSVTTRAVGISAALSYDKACSTWNNAAIADICTIHQYYRVHLLMVQLKLYLAQQIQVEPVTGDSIMRVDMPEDVREIVQTVTQVSSTMKAVLNAIGKIEHNGTVYHEGLSNPPADGRELINYRMLTVNVNTIRETLELLANVETPLDQRQAMIQMLTIPGCQIANNLLANMEQVWPAVYNMAQVLIDIHAYKNLVTRVQNRLPKHTFVNFEWSGKADVSGLWCTTQEVRIRANFGPPLVVAANRRRNAAGNFEAVAARQPGSYVRSEVDSNRSNFWCLAETPHQQTVLGTASLVGEECYLYTRYERNGVRTVAVNPVITLQSITDARR